MEEQDDTFDPDRESLVHEISEKIHGVDGSSSSSGADYGERRPPRPEFVRAKKERFSGYEELINNQSSDVDIPADLFMWKNKIVSAALLGGVTAVWFIFAGLEYHLITLICHLTILAFAIAFFWSNASIIINKKPPHFRKVSLPPELFIKVVTVLCSEINDAISDLIGIASVRDLKKFLTVIAVLWFISIVGSLCSFVTLFYILFVFLYTVPVLYERYEEKVVELSQQTIEVIKKIYAMFEAKVMSKIPIGRMNKMKMA